MPARLPLSGRSFQIDETTPRRVLEVLVEVPPELYETANSYPELALLAPDHEVYGRLFRILDAKKRHGQGLYIECGSGLIQRTAGWTPGLGDRPDTPIRYAFDLSLIDAAVFEKEVRKPQLYHLHKFDYLLSLVQMLNPGLMAANRDQVVKEARLVFVQDHLNQRQRGNTRLLMTIRDQLTNPSEICDALTERLTQRVPRTYVIRIGEDFIKKLHDYYEETKKITADYSRDQYEQFLINNYLMNGPMLNEELPQGPAAVEEALLAGKPIGGIAPVLAHAGWIKKVAEAWARQRGNTSSFIWNKRLTQARLFSTPEGSHLLFTPAKIEAAVKYVETRSPSGIKIADELTGRPIPLVHQGRGYGLLRIAHIPVDSWYSTFLDRLNILGLRPSPALDLIEAVLEKKGPNLDPLWREIVGLVMANGPEEPTCQGLQERIAVWAFSEKKRLERFSQIAKFLPGGKS